MTEVTRERVQGCPSRDTYKYFLPRDAVALTWERLSREFGEVVWHPSTKVFEIRHAAMTIRATWLRNPLTVLRRRSCAAADIAALHAAIGYPDQR